MASLEEIRITRLQKLSLLKEKGINPYPATSNREYSLKEVADTFEKLSTNPSITIAGRVMSLRPQGGLVFLHIFDGTAKFQGFLKKEDVAEEIFTSFVELVDIGDFIEITGSLFLTKKGEKTLNIKEWRMLAKSLRPLPEKWHGLQDADEKFRKRYLDFIMNQELRELFYKKATFWDTTRRILKAANFLEVETPTLEVTTGGAEATPFKTHHNDYDLPVYLRISVGELWQKRLMAAGFPRTFEIGRVYRNEGSSPDHLQEFTNMEFYAAYMNLEEGIAFTESLIKTVARETFDTLSFTIRGQQINLDQAWPRIDYRETIKEMAGIDVLSASENEMETTLQKLKVRYEGTNRERLTDTLWKYCRKQLTGPVWLVNHPKLVSPLSKANPENEETTLRVQLILVGSEMTNGFAELNDPIDQRERFDAQGKLMEAGDTEAMMPDEEFVEMLEYGMPPTFGFCYGERLFTTLADKPIRETQMFPLMRPKD